MISRFLVVRSQSAPLPHPYCQRPTSLVPRWGRSYTEEPTCDAAHLI